MKHKLFALAGLAILTTSGVALASPTLLGTTTDPTGIDGVVIDGVTYDASFSTESFNQTFSSTQPTFWQDPTAAYDAATALADDLASLEVVGLDDLDCGQIGTGRGSYVNHCGVIVPDSAVLFGLVISGPGADNDSDGTAWSPGGNLSNVVLGLDSPLGTGEVPILGYHYDLAYAVFTPVSGSVPEPDTLGLLGIALAGIGLAYRRRRMT